VVDVSVEHVESLGGEQVEVGTKIHVSALVRLGELTQDDIQVQLVTGRVGADDQLYELRVNPFPTGVEVDGGLRRYEGWVEAKRAGAIGYTVRVVPYHPLLASPAEMGLAAVPASMPHRRQRDTPNSTDLSDPRSAVAQLRSDNLGLFQSTWSTTTV
jgi:starch phosphorylase